MVFLAGIEDGHWGLIKDLHENAKSVIKWEGNLSQQFQVSQGDRQGGIFSTNLYKLYINQLLNTCMYETTGIGYRIGNIRVNSTTCADDIALISEEQDQTQIFINMAYDYAYMEGYELQPTRSVVGGGFHGHNGLDVETIVHLYKIYISPVLLYGLELILPTTSSLLLLENFQKKILKQILSLPPCVADITVNILTGILPIEAQLHIRALGLFNNICNQLESSIEKSLARRQLLIKKVPWR